MEFRYITFGWSDYWDKSNVRYMGSISRPEKLPQLVPETLMIIGIRCTSDIKNGKG
jgi:hypothetical protein